MCFEWAESALEFVRGNCFVYSLFVVPLLIAISPKTPVFAAHEFTVYRMQHFDLHSTPHGCRNSILNMEARKLYTTPYTRKCVVARLTELTYSQYQDLIQQNAGGLLILIPQNLSSLPVADQQVVMQLEKHILEEDVAIPVYFAYETEELLEMYYSMEQGSSKQKSRSAAEELPSTITSSGYQLVVSGPAPKPLPDTQIISLQGKLCGFGVEEQLPTIAIVAHYDSYGIAPGLSYGADSNGSGVAALLELARLLSRLYTNSRTHPRFNLMFLLSGGGKFNYQGTKKWIEDNIDSSDASLLPDALYTLCLDSVGDEDNLYLHVSKPPKEDSPGDIFYKELQWASVQSEEPVNVSMIHKRINLADELLSWEHERFSIRRLPAFTLSHLQSPRSLKKTTILDTRENVNVDKLARNVRIIAEALARHMYNISGETLKTGIFTEGLSIQKDYLKAWIDQLSSQPRSAQMLLSGSTKHPLILTLEQAMSRYLKDVKFSIFKPDKREPELMFYEPVSTVMNAYRVKPAIFDLFLAMFIAAYLGIIYLLITNFYRLERIIKSYSVSVKGKQS
ncbi:BOS complex subunit ncln-like [Argiope bruennichi]|uniref:BOS complex subunit ncln-like n=1 Tax=Argiope bruennichi TaxID=94029 RepID=UPI002495845A|nr:BOS complex subunit ncln-like [Argiope bruennichi]